MKSRSSPSPRSSDWKVWQCALTVPGSSARPGSAWSPRCGVPAAWTAATRPSVIATARPLCQPSGVSTSSGKSRIIVAGPSRPARDVGGLIQERAGSAPSSLVDEAAALDHAADVVDAVEVGEIAPVGDVGQQQGALLARGQGADPG